MVRRMRGRARRSTVVFVEAVPGAATGNNLGRPSGTRSPASPRGRGRRGRPTTHAASPTRPPTGSVTRSTSRRTCSPGCTSSTCRPATDRGSAWSATGRVSSWCSTRAPHGAGPSPTFSTSPSPTPPGRRRSRSSSSSTDRRTWGSTPVRPGADLPVPARRRPAAVDASPSRGPPRAGLGPGDHRSRGGGATGARNALAAVAGRATAAAARGGIALRALGADELTGVLRDLGPAPDGDVVLGVPLTGDDATGALLHAVAGLDVARCVLSVSASAVDHTLCALVRITDPATAWPGRPPSSSSPTASPPRCRPVRRTRVWSPRCPSAAVPARSPTSSRRSGGERACERINVTALPRSADRAQRGRAMSERSERIRVTARPACRPSAANGEVRPDPTA